LSFHKVEFHETKRERKYYEGKKQKALEYIDFVIKMEKGEREGDPDAFFSPTMVLLNIKKLVNDI